MEHLGFQGDALKAGRAWESLQRLRFTAELSTVTEPLVRLPHNNDWIGIALAALGIILNR